MKPRPRSVEREVAEFLSHLYQINGYSPVKRIPILGRTGPDIEVNETKLVVDVKSRIAVPQSHLLKQGELGRFGDYVGVRMCEHGNELKPRDIRPSVMVKDWLDHMDEWTKENVPSGISMIVLHRPGMRIANAICIVKTEDWRNVCKIIRTPLS